MTKSTKHTLVVFAAVLAFAMGMLFQSLTQPPMAFGLGDGSDLNQQSTGRILNVAAPGNDWTQNALTLNGSFAEQVFTVGGTGVTGGAKMTMIVTPNSTQDPQMVFTEGNGSGSPGNMQYIVGYDASDNLFRLARSYDIDGNSTDGDVIYIVDGTNDVNFLGDIKLNGGKITSTGDICIGSGCP